MRHDPEVDIARLRPWEEHSPNGTTASIISGSWRSKGDDCSSFGASPPGPPSASPIERSPVRCIGCPPSITRMPLSTFQAYRTPFQAHRTPLQVPRTPLQAYRTPFQLHRTPSKHIGRPSKHIERPSKHIEHPFKHPSKHT
jgi:hypothetical protein